MFAFARLSMNQNHKHQFTSIFAFVKVEPQSSHILQNNRGLVTPLQYRILFVYSQRDKAFIIGNRKLLTRTGKRLKRIVVIIYLLRSKFSKLMWALYTNLCRPIQMQVWNSGSIYRLRDCSNEFRINTGKTVKTCR